MNKWNIPILDHSMYLCVDWIVVSLHEQQVALKILSICHLLSNLEINNMPWHARDPAYLLFLLVILFMSDSLQQTSSFCETHSV